MCGIETTICGHRSGDEGIRAELGQGGRHESKIGGAPRIFGSRFIKLMHIKNFPPDENLQFREIHGNFASERSHLFLKTRTINLHKLLEFVIAYSR